jgi:hypothetical protein
MCESAFTGTCTAGSLLAVCRKERPRFGSTHLFLLMESLRISLHCWCNELQHTPIFLLSSYLHVMHCWAATCSDTNTQGLFYTENRLKFSTRVISCEGGNIARVSPEDMKAASVVCAALCTHCVSVALCTQC